MTIEIPAEWLATLVIDVVLILILLLIIDYLYWRYNLLNPFLWLFMSPVFAIFVMAFLTAHGVIIWI